MALPLRRNAHFAMMISDGALAEPWASFLRHLPRETLILEVYLRTGNHLRSTCGALAAHLRRTCAALEGSRTTLSPGGRGGY